MKKFFGILFLLIIAAAGVCAYFFPGIPYKYKCTHELQLTDSIWETIPDDLPPLPEDCAVACTGFSIFYIIVIVMMIFR